VRRAVVRVVTAGTLTEEGLLDARRHNYLAGLAEAGGEMGLAWLDLSTGAFTLAPTSEPALPGDLARLSPGEILLPERLLTRPALFELLAEWKPALTPLPNPRFDSDAGRRRLQEFYGDETLSEISAARFRRRRASRLCRPDPQGRGHISAAARRTWLGKRSTLRHGATSSW
jgi:DNA mismatch repair protein MutS